MKRIVKKRVLTFFMIVTMAVTQIFSGMGYAKAAETEPEERSPVLEESARAADSNLPNDPDWMQTANWTVHSTGTSTTTPAAMQIVRVGAGFNLKAGSGTGNTATDRSMAWLKTDKKITRGVFSADITSLSASVKGVSLRFNVKDNLTNATFAWNSADGWHVQVFDNKNIGIVRSGSTVPGPVQGKKVNLKVSLNLSASTLSAYVDGVEVFKDKQITYLDNYKGGGSVGFGISTGDNIDISNVVLPEELAADYPDWSDISHWNTTKRTGELFEAKGMRALELQADGGSSQGMAVYDKVGSVAKGDIQASMVLPDTGKAGVIFGYQDDRNYSALSYKADSDEWALETVSNGAASEIIAPSAPVLEPGTAADIRVIFDAKRKQAAAIVNGTSLFGNQFGGETVSAMETGGTGVFLDQQEALHIYGFSYKEEAWPETAAPIGPESVKKIASSRMTVTLDETFPSVVGYELDGKKFLGQPKKLSKVKINGVLTEPAAVESVFTGEAGTYALTLNDPDNGLDAVITIVIEVKDNILTYKITEVENKNDKLIETIQIPDLSILSVNSKQQDATFAGAKMTTDIAKSGDEYLNVNDDYIADINENATYMYAFVSNSDLSAAIYSNSEATRVKDTDTKWARIIRNSYVYGDENGAPCVAVGLNSNAWDYQHSSQSKTDGEMDQELSGKNEALAADGLFIKVILTADENADSRVDWQDGAIAYRKIMHVPLGADKVPDQVSQRIVENFGGTAAHPFLNMLDNLKRVAVSTDGLGQKIILKGYASEGHDSKHPDYYDVGKRIGGVQDMNTLIEEAKKYDADIGIHINATEMYPEADAFSDELLKRRGEEAIYNWDWIDSAYMIDTQKDLDSGARLTRLEKLKKLVPDLDFLYVDVWYNDNWEGYHLAQQIQSLGWGVATEWAYALEGDSLWSHWASDKNYGGTDNKGINSNIVRFISNHQRDVWMQSDVAGYQPLLGGNNLAGFEGWADRNTNQNYDNYIMKLFGINLPTKFLQHYEVTNWENNAKGKEEKITLKREGKGGQTVVTKRGATDTSRIITLNGKTVLADDTEADRSYLLPWTWEDGEEQKLYHWNKQGGTTEWELQDDWAAYGDVKVYELTDTGKKNELTVPVTAGKITLTAEAEKAYVIYPGNAEVKPVKAVYGAYAHITDPGFNYKDLTGWDVTGTGVSVDKKVIADLSGNEISYNDPRLKFEANSADAAISQSLTGLEPGRQYTAMVHVDNESPDAKAILEVKAGGNTKSAYTYKTIAPNCVKSDANHSLFSDAAGGDFTKWAGRMNVMQVSFWAPSSGNAVLSLKREAGTEPAYFDDVRVVESSSNYYPEGPNVFVQDFENSEVGLYPFVTSYGSGVSDNRTHLSEEHAPFTSRGTKLDTVNANMINDVIHGNWSLKIQAQLSGLMYQTIPQNLRFLPGVTYRVSFQYETGTTGPYTFVVGDGDYAENKSFVQEIPMVAGEGTQTASFEVVGSESGNTWIGLYANGAGVPAISKIDKGIGRYNFVLDDLRVEDLDAPPYIVPSLPDGGPGQDQADKPVNTGGSGSKDDYSPKVEVAPSLSVSTTKDQATLKLEISAGQVPTATKEKPVALEVTIPKEEAMKQIAEGKAVTLAVILPDSLVNNPYAKVSKLILPAGVLDHARQAKQELTATVGDTGGRLLYSWTFDKKLLADTKSKLTDINLSLETASAKDYAPVKDTLAKDEASRDGMAVHFEHDGKLPIHASVRIRIPESTGIKTEGKAYLYYFNAKTKKLEEERNNEYSVSKDGYVSVNVNHCSDYVLLPKKADKSIMTALMSRTTVKAKKSTLAPKKTTAILVKLPESVAAADKITYKSSKPSVASVGKTGKITAKKPGSTVITTKVWIGKSSKSYTTKITVKG